MQFKAKDGSSHPSQLSAFQAGSKPPAQAAGPSGADQEQAPSIQDDPAAMQLVDQLKQLGYTGDDVAQAMDGMGGEQDQGMGGGEAAKAAPMQIPGLQ